MIADSFLADLDMRTLHHALVTREHFYVRQHKALQQQQQQHGDDWRAVLDEDTAFLRGVAARDSYALPDSVLNSVPCPVPLTGHQKGPLRPGIARECASIIPNCSFYVASEGGHPHIKYPFMWSNPDMFRALADLFLSSITQQVLNVRRQGPFGLRLKQTPATWKYPVLDCYLSHPAHSTGPSAATAGKKTCSYSVSRSSGSEISSTK